MKRIISVFAAVLLLCSAVMVPTYAREPVEPTDVTVNVMDIQNGNNELDITVSDPMTYTEMVSHYAASAGISYEEAVTYFPTNDEVSGRAAPVTYRELTVGLPVTDTYRPHIAFFCETSENGQYWGILSIYRIELVRSYNGISKQFSGDLTAWLRSAYQIEFSINGDFYDNGSTTVAGGVGLEVGLGESTKLTFSFSGSSTSSHYKYYHEHRTVAFQQ